MPDTDNPTSGAAPGASPRHTPVEIAAHELRQAALEVPPERLAAAVRYLPAILSAAGDDVIDDLAEMDFDDPRYLILDPTGGSDDE